MGVRARARILIGLVCPAPLVGNLALLHRAARSCTDMPGPGRDRPGTIVLRRNKEKGGYVCRLPGETDGLLAPWGGVAQGEPKRLLLKFSHNLKDLSSIVHGRLSKL